jgi:hypothetical protein
MAASNLAGRSIAIVAVVCAATAARGQTWVGGDPLPVGLWSQAANWDGGVPVSGSTTELNFAVDALHNGDTIQNLANPFEIAGLQFSGSTFFVQGNGLQVDAYIGQSSNAPQFIQVPISIGGTFSSLQLVGSGFGTVQLGAPINDGARPGSLTVQGSTFESTGRWPAPACGFDPGLCFYEHLKFNSTRFDLPNYPWRVRRSNKRPVYGSIPAGLAPVTRAARAMVLNSSSAEIE